MHQNFTRSFDSLRAILALTDAFFADRPISQASRYAVDLAIDELFTNMVKYNANSPSHIGLGLAWDGEAVTVTLSDYQSDPFDLTRASPVDISLAAEDRPIGGLGIHLVKKMVDSLQYDFANGCSTIVFTKKTGNEDA